MREYKYKAKRIDNGEWIEGDLKREFDKNGNIAYFITNPRNKWLNTCQGVYPTTICEYTGLHDKNGKDIWEKDIITSDCFKYVVKFGEYNSMWCSCECECNQHVGFYLSEGISDSCWDMELLHDDNLEVIGNIFDNSELLKESE
jgi:uncharacterized phage protein (TIGR01671 family)